MPDLTSSKPSSNHLSELIAKVRDFQIKEDLKFKKAVERRAAKFAIDDPERTPEWLISNGALIVRLPDVFNDEGECIAEGLRVPVGDARVPEMVKKENEHLELVYRGRKTRDDLRAVRSVFNTLGLYEGRAENQLYEKLASKSGNSYSHPTVWEHVVDVVLPRLRTPDVDEDMLEEYAYAIRWGGRDSSDTLSVEIVGLHDEGVTAKLLESIWKKYAPQAAEMELPQPKDKKDTSKPGWGRLRLQEQTGGDDLAILDGQEHRISPAAFTLLELLQAKCGDMILGNTLSRETGQRPSVIYKSLSPELRRIIDKPGKRRTGYRML